VASRVARLGLEGSIGIDRRVKRSARVFERPRLGGLKCNEGSNRNAGDKQSLGAHEILPAFVVGAVASFSAVLLY